jgi:hypothetical protein
MQILGVTLVVAALVIPAISARLLTDSFNRMIVLATTIGALTGLIGMYLNYYVDLASGVTIVLLTAIVFLSFSPLPQLKSKRTDAYVKLSFEMIPSSLSFSPAALVYYPGMLYFLGYHLPALWIPNGVLSNRSRQPSELQIIERRT